MDAAGGVILTAVSTDELIPGIPRPQTRVADAAYEVATTYCSPAIVNHCVRSYIWSATYAVQREISFDAELLYVSAMLHDIGLVAEFDSHTVPFEDAGGHVAWVFAAGAGWPVARRIRVSEVIVRHMRETELSEDVEGSLLAIATSLDISGRHPEWWPQQLREDVVRRLPRLALREAKTGELRGRLGGQWHRRADGSQRARRGRLGGRGLAVRARGEVNRGAVTGAAVDEDGVARGPEGRPRARDPSGTEAPACLAALLGARSCHHVVQHVLLLGHLGHLDELCSVHVMSSV